MSRVKKKDLASLSPVDQDIIQLSKKTPSYQVLGQMEELILQRFQSGHVDFPTPLQKRIMTFLLKKKPKNHNTFNVSTILNCLISHHTPEESQIRSLVQLNRSHLEWFHQMIHHGYQVSLSMFQFLLQQQVEPTLISRVLPTHKMTPLIKKLLIQPKYAEIIEEYLLPGDSQLVSQLARQEMEVQLDLMLDHGYEPQVSDLQELISYTSLGCVTRWLEKASSISSIPPDAWSWLILRARRADLSISQLMPWLKLFSTYHYQIPLESLQKGFAVHLVPRDRKYLDPTISEEQLYPLCRYYHHYPWPSIKKDRTDPQVCWKDLCARGVYPELIEHLEQHPEVIDLSDEICLEFLAFHKIEPIIERLLDAGKIPNLTCLRHLCFRGSYLSFRVQDILQTRLIK